MAEFIEETWDVFEVKKKREFNFPDGSSLLARIYYTNAGALQWPDSKLMIDFHIAGHHNESTMYVNDWIQRYDMQDFFDLPEVPYFCSDTNVWDEITDWAWTAVQQGNLSYDRTLTEADRAKGYRNFP